jgi:hypothetical protein
LESSWEKKVFWSFAIFRSSALRSGDVKQREVFKRIEWLQKYNGGVMLGVKRHATPNQ